MLEVPVTLLRMKRNRPELQRAVIDLAVRQRLLEFFDAFFCDLCVIKCKGFEPCETVQVLQSGIGDSRVDEDQMLEIR